MTTTISADNGSISGSAGLKMTSDSSGVLALQTGANTTAVTVDTSGNVGVGVTPSAWRTTSKATQIGYAGSLVASTATNNVYLGANWYINSTPADTYINNGYASLYQQQNGIHYWFNAPSGTAGNAITFTQAMTLDASGNLLVGTTSQFNSGLVCIQSDNSVKNPIAIKNTGTTYGAGYHLILFANSSGAQAGAIDQTAVTTVNYNTASDARLKEDKGIATDTSVIDNIIVHDFVWKADGRVDKGVFAQEAYEVKPSAISVGKDDLTEDGSLETPWSVDYSKFVPDLIVYAQQLKKTVEAQTETINALTTRLTALENK